MLPFRSGTQEKTQNNSPKTEKTLQENLAGVQQADNKLILIYNLDVFEYFDLGGFGKEYDTDLKKQVFSKTPEYAEKLNDLRLKKTEMLTSLYYVTINKFYTEEYDVKKKGFEINIGNVNYGAYGYARAPKSIPTSYPSGGYDEKAAIYFPSLPTKNIRTIELLLYNGYFSNRGSTRPPVAATAPVADSWFRSRSRSRSGSGSRKMYPLLSKISIII